MHKLMQLLGENARADRTVPAISMKVADDVAHVYVYDVIDSYWGASAKSLVEALATAGDKPVHMHVNSPGGDVFEARAMVSAVRAHQAKGGSVTSFIDGLAASAATYLALAGDAVHIADGGMFMVHNSWTLAWGNKSELRSTADLLDKIDGTISADYARKTGAKAEQITAWMDAETWFTGAEALAAGFVDSVIEPPKADDSKAARWNLSAYANAPKLNVQRVTSPGAALKKPKAETSDALNARQGALYDAFEEVASEFGLFDQSSGAAGAHYMQASPFAAEGLKCANCAMYSGQRSCEVVAGDISPDAVCKLWIIPESLLQQQTSNLADHADRVARLNRSRFAALLLKN